MPLLKKTSFEKESVPDYLRDDEEVFYCEMTNEIFRDYHDFSERIFLCNSTVWTCSLTGKSNLTYQEAQESEEHAIKCLREFPNELKQPILYLATLTKRTCFGDMAEDIFSYIKDRYFIGENLEASFTANKWKDCHILSVIAPKEEDYKEEVKTMGSHTPSERHFIPSANLYKYEIEHLDADDKDISEIMIVDSTQIRRKKALFSRDKVKLFLKQNVEQDNRGIFIIKKDVLDKFNVPSMRWDTIFDGPLPCMQSSKNFEKAVNGKKRQRQETLSKYLEKNGLGMKKEVNKEKKNNLLEQMKKREEEFKKQKQLNEEQKALERQRKKEESIKLSQYLKDWSKAKEDLELEDQLKLPLPTPIKSKVPDRYFGDLIHILEFVHTFQKLLSTKNFFPGGFSLEIIERALVEKEVAGPLTDLIQMLMTAIFNCQEDESNSYNTDVEILKDIKEENISLTPSAEEGTRLATLASRWPIKYQGLPLSRLPLYSLTVSEVLRLHLLASGARIKETGSKWRYALRGGFTSEDDPGLYLRLHQAHIIKALAIHNVVQLSLHDKIKIILCLIDQLLTYADFRDIVEEKIENIKRAKVDLRAAKATERRRELELVTQRAKLKKELKDDPEKLQGDLEKLEDDNKKKQIENQRKIEKLIKTANEGQTLLGRDRAYRKYLRIDSVPGLFINWEDEHAGRCLDKQTVQYPDLVSANRGHLMAHIQKLYGSSIKKENSPTKSPKTINGIKNSGNDPDACIELLLCTADETNCPVHKESSGRTRWSFFHEKGQFEELIKALNKRGFREGELKDVLKCEEDELMNLISKTPVALLNPDLVVVKEEKDDEMVLRAKKKDRYEDANLGYPPEMKPEVVLENALIENLLEMEEKINGGALGNLKIKDRDRWRNYLQDKNYIEFEKLITELSNDKENKHLNVKKNGKVGSRSSTPEVQDKKEEEDYHDPGKFLGDTVDFDSEDSETRNKDDILLMPFEATKLSIRCLANALCHVAEAVESRHLKRPLGHADIKPSLKTKFVYDVFDKWRQSLLASTSFSQIFLHYGTLDSCVMWSRSALLARCRICRRQKDSENMLLCDSCNLGHHMYCLKPKLTAVPKGDWFCDKCKTEKEKQEKLLSPEPAKKKRRIFVDEEEEQDSGNEDGVEEEEDSREEMSEDDDEENDVKPILCQTCGSGGEIVQCEKCDASYHKECVEPPLRRLPRGSWKCRSCSSNKSKRDERIKPRYDEENGYDSDYGGGAVRLSGITYSRRRCAAKANHRIHAFAKVLRSVSSKSTSEEDDSDDEVVDRGKRSSRRDDNRDDLPLHNAALQELLSDVMKHDAAWPFLRPVQQKEVPDYYDIITSPMDFGTIKYQLNMGKYSTDSQVMKDVTLVFENCNTYNSSSDEVYQCGEKLLEYFTKKAKEMGLKVPPELDLEEEVHSPKLKKKRTK